MIKFSHMHRPGSDMVIVLPNRHDVKLNEAENAWKPSKKVVDVGDGVRDELLNMRIRSILNKLCPQNFDTLVAQFNELVIDTEDQLTKAMELVFEKAVDEPGFSVAYARMCHHLSKKEVFAESGILLNFRTLLLKRFEIVFNLNYS